MEEEPACKKTKTDSVATTATRTQNEGPTDDEVKKVIRALDERLKSHNDNRISVQKKLHEVCEGRRKQVDNFEDIINGELEVKFIDEDNRLQNALGSLKTAFSEGDKSKLDEALQNAKAELFVGQSYGLVAGEVKDFPSIGKLSIEKSFVPEWLDCKQNSKTCNAGRISLNFTSKQDNFFSENGLKMATYKVMIQRKGESGEVCSLKNCDEDQFYFVPNFIVPGTIYTMKIKAELQGSESKWSREAKFTSPRFSECCIWKECHNHANLEMKYSVDEKNPRVVTKAGEGGYSTIIGNTSLPLNKVTSWSIKILKSRENDGL